MHRIVVSIIYVFGLQQTRYPERRVEGICGLCNMLPPRPIYSLVMALRSSGVPSGAIPFFAKILLCLINLAWSKVHRSIALQVVSASAVAIEHGQRGGEGQTYMIRLTSSTPA